MILAPLGLCVLLLIVQAGELDELWSLSLGEGFSAVAASGSHVFASYREPGSPETRVVAVALATGEVAWRAAFADPAREGQEDYGGGRGPHATPLLHRGRVFVVGYGGGLFAFDARNGAESWSIDLVDDLGVTPVQFGFAASPVALDELVVVAAGGEVGVLAFEAETGEIAWSSPAYGASYVTPALATLAGTRQLICVMEDETVGLDPETGGELWQVPHVRPDLTNYAMLTVLADGGLVVSGQGNRGARRIDVTRADDGWRAAATWHARAAQFSHGAVIERDGFLYGSNGSMLCALDVSDGGLAFKLRGFGESNLIAAGPWTVRMQEEGELTLLRLRPERIEVFARQRVLAPKAWAPPTVAGEVFLLRDAERLVALRLPAADELPTPLEALQTPYTAGAVQVPAALIAFAHGAYEAEDGRVFELLAARGELALRRPGATEAVALAPRSEELFEDPDGGQLRLVRVDDVVPTAVEYTVAGQTVRARRLDWQPLALDEAELERVLGPWIVAGEIELEIYAAEDGLEATSSAYADLRFRVRAEAAERLWLEAIDAPYGIPVVLLEVGEEELLVHQASETVAGVRP